MLLKEITLNNFRQYKGCQKIVFSTDLQKNLTLIIGKNTCGKTTLVQSFIWALYGVHNFNKGQLLNEELYESLKEEKPEGYSEDMYVRIILNSNGMDYRITRAIKYIKKRTSIQLAEEKIEITYGNDEEGFRTYTKDPNNLINSLLPKEFSNYFFFWGERINNIDSNKNIKEAVSNFLGLTAIDNCRKHLQGIAKDYTLKLASTSKDDSSLATLAIELKNLTEKDIPELDRQIEDKKLDVESSEKRFKEYDQKLLNNAGVAEIQMSIIKGERRVENLEKDIKSQYHKLLNKFNQKPIGYFANFFYNDILEVLEHIPDNEKGLAHQTEKSIMELINRGKCVCGRPLVKGTKPYDDILEELEKIPPKSISSLADDFKKEMRQRDNSNEYSYNFQEAYKELRDKEQELSDESQDLENNKKRIENGKDKEIQLIQQRRNESLNRTNKYRSELDRLQNDKKYKEESVTRISNSIKAKEHINEKDKEIQMYLDYTNAVIENINKEYIGRENELKVRLRELVNHYFKEMYHGQREIIIDDDFKMKLISKIGNKTFATEESPGLQTVKNFAFIAALVQIAKEKRQQELSSHEDEDHGPEFEPYPLVLDAPFSQSDEVHVSNICKLISNVAEQTIMAIMEKDWKYAENIMQDKVGLYYELEKISETETRIKKVENYYV